jgi:acetyltransferase-like isoleucine patch superfamily enzyme
MKTTTTCRPSNEAAWRILNHVEFGEGVVVHGFTNLYGCRIGANSQVGPFVEIQAGVSIGRFCKIQSHSFICEGVTLGDGVFVGHGVMFTNDKHPVAATDERLVAPGEWELERVVVGDGASIGSGAIVVGPVRVGHGALVGAGAVITRDVPPESVVAGVPARVIARRQEGQA